MYNTILIPIGNDEEVDTRVSSAITFGKKFGSHIKGLHVIPTLKSLEQLTPYAYYSYELYTSIWDTQKQKAQEQKKKFLDTMNADYNDFEWCEKDGDFMRTLKIRSRTCNLTIISQGEDTYTDIMGSMARFMMESTLPVLTVPSSGLKEDFSSNILVAWDNSAESARAVQDAMPLLLAAKEVTVVSIIEERKNLSPTADICNMLIRMGIKVKGVDEPAHDDRAKRILQLAREWNVGLIVAGAWGHKRLLEVIFGGMTRSLYTNQEFPIFFSH